MKSVERNHRPIMLVEDQADEVDIFRFACERASIQNPVLAFEHGAEAVAYLSDPGRPQPALVITDIKMPWMDGFELLQWIRQNKPQAPYRVLVLSSSLHAGDADRALALGAAEFISKPGDFNRTVEILRRIGRQLAAEGNKGREAVKVES